MVLETAAIRATPFLPHPEQLSLQTPESQISTTTATSVGRLCLFQLIPETKGRSQGIELPELWHPYYWLSPTMPPSSNTRPSFLQLSRRRREQVNSITLKESTLLRISRNGGGRVPAFLWALGQSCLGQERLPTVMELILLDLQGRVHTLEYVSHLFQLCILYHQVGNILLIFLLKIPF